jgi:hypothetical protein
MRIKNFDRFLNEEMSDDELERQTAPTHKVFKDLKIDGDMFLKKGDHVFLDREGERCITISGYQEGSITDFMSNEEIDHYLQPLNNTQKASWKFGLSESDQVKLDKALREYTLEQRTEALFLVKSSSFQKEFSVTPYNNESIKILPSIQDSLEEAIGSLDVNDLYNSITKAERVPYRYGNIFTSTFTLTSVPELNMKLQPEQQKDMESSEREFLMNSFSGLNRETKDLIIDSMRDRAEILCVVIQALFYYLRTTDSSKFYQKMSSHEILDLYKEEIEKASEKESFSTEGPFSNIDNNATISDDTTVAYWKCEKDQESFIIKATISPSQLKMEDANGPVGLKFSLSTNKEQNKEKDFNLFDYRELASRVKLFNSKILKKK